MLLLLALAHFNYYGLSENYPMNTCGKDLHLGTPPFRALCGLPAVHSAGVQNTTRANKSHQLHWFHQIKEMLLHHPPKPLPGDQKEGEYIFSKLFKRLLRMMVWSMIPHLTM